MAPYFAIFLLLCFCTIFSQKKPKLQSPIFSSTVPLWVSVILILFIGLRYDVGGDWSTYSDMMNDAYGLSFFDGLALTDPGYAFLNWFTATYIGSFTFLNLICALIFIAGLISFSRQSRNPALLLVLSFPVLIINVGMGYVRQSVALGLFMWALPTIRKGKWTNYFLINSVACLFHKSAFVLLVVGWLAKKNRGRWGTSIGAVLISILVFKYLVSTKLEEMQINYIEAAYSSDGAWPRLLMLIVPSFLYIFFGNRMGHDQSEKRFWSIFGFTGLLLPIALYFSPSSTAVDRLALYWIPLQILVLSDYPSLIKSIDFRRLATSLLIVYAFLVLTVWLFFAAHAVFWVPYQLVFSFFRK